MTRIITHNNTRYRVEDGHAATFTTSDGGEYAKPLPEIEDWPGHRPEQYLANSHDQPDCPVRKGDLLLTEGFIDWSFTVRETDEPATLASLAEGPDDDLYTPVYLISRANPEHDAEDTQ